MEIVDHFKYLGIMCHGRGAFHSGAGGDWAGAALRAQGALHQRCKELGIQDPLLKLNLYDLLVRPNLLYGVEVWGPDSLSRSDSEPKKFYQNFLR